MVDKLVQLLTPLMFLHISPDFLEAGMKSVVTALGTAVARIVAWAHPLPEYSMHKEAGQADAERTLHSLLMGHLSVSQLESCRSFKLNCKKHIY